MDYWDYFDTRYTTRDKQLFPMNTFTATWHFHFSASFSSLNKINYDCASLVNCTGIPLNTPAALGPNQYCVLSGVAFYVGAGYALVLIKTFLHFCSCTTRRRDIFTNRGRILKSPAIGQQERLGKLVKTARENSGHIRVLHGQATRKSYDVTVAMSCDTRRKSQDVVLSRVMAVCRKIRFDLRKGRCERGGAGDEIATQQKINVLSQD